MRERLRNGGGEVTGYDQPGHHRCCVGGRLLAKVRVPSGNSRVTDDRKHGELLAAKGISFADGGVSGGVWGLPNGYGLMAGGRRCGYRARASGLDALRPEGERPDSSAHVGGVGAIAATYSAR